MSKSALEESGQRTLVRPPLGDGRAEGVDEEEPGDGIPESLEELLLLPLGRLEAVRVLLRAAVGIGLLFGV